jgi:hypothetical protein
MWRGYVQTSVSTRFSTIDEDCRNQRNTEELLLTIVDGLG